MISLRGVRVHNLKNIDLDLPHRQLIVFCGPSGSGKSSLAFDTLYAEGQRRYIECFAAYTRQFLDRLEKPDADQILGLPAAIAVAAGGGSRSSRSTVATATEILDFLRVLWARVGRVACESCGREVKCHTPESAAMDIASLVPGTRLLIAFLAEDSPTADALRGLAAAGFQRVVAGGMILRMEELIAGKVSMEGTRPLVVVDRLTVPEPAAEGLADFRSRLVESLEMAFEQGGGTGWVLAESQPSGSTALAGRVESIDGKEWRRFGFNANWSCVDCGRDYLEPQPRLFSFNHPLGACPTCEGSGTVHTGRGKGRPKKPAADEDAACPDCRGKRLRPEALCVRVGGLGLADLLACTIGDALEKVRHLDLTDSERVVARFVGEQVVSRLGYLNQVGLAYLTLDRPLSTLSGGEAQRVSLTGALGSNLVNLLYVLDEPSVGLHPRDTEKLLESILQLKRRGNTVVVVEHDETVIRAADQVVEIGPGAGEFGGRVVFQGPPGEIEQSAESLTGNFLSGRRAIRPPALRRTATHGWIRLVGARKNNLSGLTVEFPLGVLCLVTGVSGSGKSTLVEETLYPALCGRLRKPVPAGAVFDDVVGDGQIDDVVLIDQGPIGRSPRSNPVTYVKVFDEIRDLFAETVAARTRNYPAGHFSFNVSGGRCETCEGEGSLRVDMQFLADVYMKCPDCEGKRYRRDVLEVTHRGKNVAQVLRMTVREAFSFFRGENKIRARLQPLIDVGLDYLQLGQPANTLSGGESQRLKLAAYLAGRIRRRTLFLLDEPTTGLHDADVVRLLDCFEALLAVGHSLIVVEHNLAMMKAADYLIDLGPGAGAAGGRVVAAGPPEAVARVPESITGHFLAVTMNSDEPRGT
jgi:excinuclease ABC subunit A